MLQHVLRIIISVLTVLFYTQTSMAVQTDQQIAPPQPGAISSTTIDQTVSPIVERLMAKKNIPGASVIVVKDGNIVFKKGYGFADQDNKTPVDPDTSIFHIGSVTKLFTATAAMQLHDQGKLDLHSSINKYLKAFKVEEPFGRPITMANLLTHTGGLHYKLVGTVTPFGQVSTPLDSHLAKALPDPARTPGFISVYSDYGMGLAGHVIEAVSGMSYQDYVDQHILKPLEMDNSGLILTPERSLQMAMPGAADPSNFPPADFNYSNFAPATEIHSSAGDIAKFMLMQLGHKDGTNAQILKPETRKLMQTRQFSPHPSTFSWGYAFRETMYNGHPAIGHSGSWFKHLGRLTLLPQFDLGIYVVMNERYSAIFKDVTQAVVDLYVPKNEIQRPSGNEKPISEPLSQFAGIYTTGQLTTTTTERLMMIAEPHTVFDIEVEDNALVIKGSKNSGDRYFEVEPNFFLRTDGKRNLTFVKDPSNGDLYASFNGGGGNIRITEYERPSTQGILALIAFAGMIGGLLWQRKTGISENTPQLYKINKATLAISFLFIPLAIGILLAGQALGLHISAPWWVEIIFRMPWLIILLMIAGIGVTFQNRANVNTVAQLPIITGTSLYLAILINWNLL